jgi:UDP-glucose 4-epimerase
MAPTALVVGCNGFLGRHLAARLVSDGYRVDGVVHRSRAEVPPTVRVVSIGVEGAAGEAKAESFYDVVFALAAIWPTGATTEREPSFDERMVATNVRLIDTLHQRFPASRLVLASSVAVYGQAPGVRTERLLSEEPSRYGQTKIAAELLAGAHASFAVLRFTSLCGVGMAPTTFVPRVVRQARGVGRAITLFGDGSRRQDYLVVTDAVELLVRAAQSVENGVFLGARGVSVENRVIAAYVAERVAGCGLCFAGEDSSRSFDYDPRATWDTFGFAPRRTVFEAVDALLQTAVAPIDERNG